MSDSAQDATAFLVNLADADLGAVALSASDDFFAPRERMLNPDPAVFIPGKYDDNGKWMDGWESRRKRGPGHDHCIVRLAYPGTIATADFDTSHFTGNFPPAASLEAWCGPGDPGPEARWTEIVPATGLGGNAHHLVPVASREAWTHVRLNIFPDGGMARLRLFGTVQCDWTRRDRTATYDLAAVENGGRALACNDAHYGTPANLLKPGRSKNMGDGWETRRRREPGNDWAIIALGHPGTIREIEVATTHFKGNFPDRCSIQAALSPGGTDRSLVTQSMFWPMLLPEQKLAADTAHVFTAEIAALGPVSHLRLNSIPDGGIARLRVRGTPA